LFDDRQLNEIIEKTKSEIDLVLKNLGKTSLVLLNVFTSLSFSTSARRKTKLEELADQLNQYLANNIPANVRLVELEKLIASIGVEESFEWQSKKSPDF
jgi:hypothetical protein